jgi:hypothetical protein
MDLHGQRASLAMVNVTTASNAFDCGCVVDAQVTGGVLGRFRLYILSHLKLSI